jgi:DNA-binding response OmpR family regulator
MHNEKLERAALLSGKRILIVEDEAIIALTLEAEIMDAGAEVIGPAFDLQSAVRFASQPLDAAVLDINLRGEKVFAAARVLRDRGVPMLFASANCDDLDTAGSEFAGYPRLEKPLSIEPLLATLAGLVRSIRR